VALGLGRHGLYHGDEHLWTVANELYGKLPRSMNALWDHEPRVKPELGSAPIREIRGWPSTVHGKGTPEARQWVQPLLGQLHQDDTGAVIRSLKDIEATVRAKLREKVQAQITYFVNNQNRINYRQILDARDAVKKGTATPVQQIKACEPLGSGAIESTCRQYQCRFKRTGQFWSLQGDEALMCLETFWRNNRWHDLFPHAKPPPLANN
jgi:hypothetical protein